MFGKSNLKVRIKKKEIIRKVLLSGRKERVMDDNVKRKKDEMEVRADS